MVAKLITRGFGKNSSPITSGMGGFFAVIAETSRRVIRAGRSAAKRTIEEITIYMKLLRVNGEKILSKVTSQTLAFDEQKRVAINHVETKKTFDDVKVNVKRHT